MEEGRGEDRTGERRKEEMRGKKERSGVEDRRGKERGKRGVGRSCREKHLRTSWLSRIFKSVLDFPDQVLPEVLRAPECQQPGLEEPTLEEL